MLWNMVTWMDTIPGWCEFSVLLSDTIGVCSSCSRSTCTVTVGVRAPKKCMDTGSGLPGTMDCGARIKRVLVQVYMWGEVSWVEVSRGEVNSCFSPFINIFRLYMYMTGGFYSWRNWLLLGVNQQPSVSNWQLALMGFKPESQRRRANSFKARRLHPLSMEPRPLVFNLTQQSFLSKWPLYSFHPLMSSSNVYWNTHTRTHTP